MLKKSQYQPVLHASRPPVAMEALCSKAKAMIKGLSMEEEETTAYGDIIYKSQQKRNNIQVFRRKKKILVVRGR